MKKTTKVFCHECGATFEREVIFYNDNENIIDDTYCNKCDHYTLSTKPFNGVDVKQFTEYEMSQETEE